MTWPAAARDKQGQDLQQVLSIAEQKNLLVTHSAQAQKIFKVLLECHTASLGYHKYQCDNKTCSHTHVHYNSCGNRHCPQCGALKREQWLRDRLSELLPVKYYHTVFTLPHELNALCMGNRKVMFDLLFEAASITIQTISGDKQFMGAAPGIISVLHSWGQQLSFHPHIHCIVSGGGLDINKKWITAKKAKYNYLFPVKAMSKIYRAVFMKRLKACIAKGKVSSGMTDDDWNVLKEKLYAKDWVVYCRQPFGGPQAVMEYLGRYTHKVAISNHRILKVEQDGVTFNYKDYADHGKTKTMQLSVEEFLRRFAHHILPKHFTKIRMYGYLANRGRTARLADLYSHLKLPRPMPKVKLNARVWLLTLTGADVQLCPRCKQGMLQLIEVVRPRGDPSLQSPSLKEAWR